MFAVRYDAGKHDILKALCDDVAPVLREHSLDRGALL